MARIPTGGFSGTRGLVLRSSLVDEIQAFISENEVFETKVQIGLDLLVETYAHTIVGFAQKRSMGPLDPGGRNKKLAWLIPVRRITGKYYSGWYDKPLSSHSWQVSNSSREAYFIEFGINHQGTGKPSSGGNVRVRRPILKMSVQDAIEFYDGMHTMSGLVGGAWSFTSAGSPALVGGSLYASGTIGIQTRSAASAASFYEANYASPQS